MSSEKKENITNTKVSDIWKKEGNINEIYKAWEKEIMKIKGQSEKSIKKNNIRKAVRNMISPKRKIKKKLQEKKLTKNLREKLKFRNKLLYEHINEEEKQQFTKRIEATIKSLSKQGGGIDETKFWEFRRKIKKPNEETVTSMKDKEGYIVDTKNEIMNVYQKFYEE